VTKIPPPSIFTRLQVHALRRIAQPIPSSSLTVYDGKSKVAALLGTDLLSRVHSLHVMDFGCGNGLQAVEMAKAGAARVQGVDIDEAQLAAARVNAENEGVADRCEFVARPRGSFDLILSLDCFEHYSDPDLVLDTMFDALRPNGSLYVSFGPPWYHPWGAHLIELPPWSHVWFGEEAVVRWRQLMRGGDATTYRELGLNRMTLARFECLIRASQFTIESLKIVPIRRLRWLHNRVTREFCTSVVQAELQKPAMAG
jgi:SAM-dependent methyltransferase